MSISTARLIASRFSPFGPIFTKELRTTSRRKRTYWLRAIYLGALLLCLLLAYVSSSSYYSGAAMRLQAQAQLGQGFFVAFSLFSVSAMALLSPIVTSTAISGERQHKTLHVLLMTPITSWQIISGKLFSRLLTAFTLLGLTLPVLALVRLLGGVELEQMLGVMCLALSTAVAGAALGLLLSCLINRAFAVILLSYASMLLVYAFFPFVLAMLMQASAGSGSGPPRIPFFQWMSYTNPFFCAGMISTNAMGRFSVGWSVCVMAHLGFAVAVIILCGALLRRMARREGEGESTVASPAFPPSPLALPAAVLPLGESTLPTRATEGVNVAVELGPPPPAFTVHPGRTVSDHPVLWRETRRPLMTRTWQRIVGAIVTVGLLIFVYILLGINDELHREGTQLGFVCIFQGLLLLISTIVSATAIAQEQESDTWTVLLASPLSGTSIVLGKVMGTLKRMLWPTLLVIGHFLIFTIAGVINADTFLLLCLLFVAYSSFFIATGTYFSLRISKVIFAVVLNLAVPIVMYAVVPTVLAILEEMTHSHRVVDQFLWYLPFYWMCEAIDSQNAFTHHLEMGSTVTHGQFLLLAAGVGLAHLALGATVVWYTILRFDRIVGRAPRGHIQRPSNGFPVSYNTLRA